MKKTFIFLAIVSLFYSCNDDFLDEKPEDFLSSANAYTTYADFTASVNNLYFLFRRQYFSRDENRPFDFIYGTDLVYDGEPHTNRHSRMDLAYRPSGDIATVHWNLLYKTISEANAIIDRSANSEMTETELNDILSQARFFRGISYKNLATLYGGVPLVLNEVTAPKVDFKRNTKEEVLNQVVDDLLFASENLPSINEAVDGRINNLVANHYLAEAYLALGRNTDAIAATTKVIDNPNTALMTSRFGTRRTETPGDVFWDLFRKNNQNSDDNTEALWVIQFEIDVQGGGLETGRRAGGYPAERHFAPLLRFSPFNSWPVGDYTGGRGIGWGISTTYYSNTIWGDDSSNPDWNNDIRNANHNFVRVFDQSNSEALKVQNITQEYSTEVLPRRREFYAFPSKITTPYNHPEGNYRTSSTPFALTSNAGMTYTDQYMLRLAETYLLRAEAYLADNKPGLAADDVNVVRTRSNASLATSAEMNIDYILDERARELGLEEKRRLTLMRLGVLYDRVNRFNPYYMDEGMQPHFNLWPIPADEIEGNRGAVLEQNPGYN
ncbi:membrane protein [Tamlana nanhaiensis]|uniref:Membrane protein n=1 Tax=Neotamlana nanhaiensis TaxID=1382798 RepID=A0A0D7W6N8_9FLAO|nr:RagB/SusD family nutrient uptake outer membrane protein [Tamlana nanhaiensis]KJD34714.1 membrane protein [Tamlana nanhaiensis]